MTEVKIVVGANYGDEGKGLLTNYFCEQAIKNNKSCINILSNGGAQRGHTVDLVDKSHVFQHLGSGTFAGADTYFPEQFILNPMQFAKEYKELAPTTNIYYNLNCRWSTPFDMIANQILEQTRDSKRHGSCGMGIWETALRWTRMKNYPIGAFASLSEIGQINYLNEVKQYFIGRLAEEGINDIPGEWKSIWNSPNLIYNFVKDVMFFIRSVTPKITNDFIFNYGSAVFENGQGLLLTSDVNNVHTTPSNTTSKNALDICAGKTNNIEVCYVSRSYLTRHGAGEFEEDKIEVDKSLDHNQFNEFQGSLRYGELDTKDLIKRIENDDRGYRQTLALTHLNEVDLNLSDFENAKLSGLYLSNDKLTVNKSLDFKN